MRARLRFLGGQEFTHGGEVAAGAAGLAEEVGCCMREGGEGDAAFGAGVGFAGAAVPVFSVGADFRFWGRLRWGGLRGG